MLIMCHSWSIIIFYVSLNGKCAMMCHLDDNVSMCSLENLVAGEVACFSTCPVSLFSLRNDFVSKIKAVMIWEALYL